MPFFGYLRVLYHIFGMKNKDEMHIFGMNANAYLHIFGMKWHRHTP